MLEHSYILPLLPIGQNIRRFSSECRSLMRDTRQSCVTINTENDINITTRQATRAHVFNTDTNSIQLSPDCLTLIDFIRILNYSESYSLFYYVVHLFIFVLLHCIDSFDAMLFWFYSIPLSPQSAWDPVNDVSNGKLQVVRVRVLKRKNPSSLVLLI